MPSTHEWIPYASPSFLATGLIELADTTESRLDSFSASALDELALFLDNFMCLKEEDITLLEILLGTVYRKTTVGSLDRPEGMGTDPGWLMTAERNFQA